MNYNDQILEDKVFNFVKQLMFNIGIVICIVFGGLLILIFGFKFGVYEVLSNSQAPIFVKGDLVVTKPEKEYKIGDIIKFDFHGKPVTHRLIAISKDGSIYYCHGDNVVSVNPDNGSTIVDWQEDSKYLQGLIDDGVSLNSGNSRDYQAVTKQQIKGKVILDLDGLGSVFGFVKNHIVLCVLIISGIWCVYTVAENELEYKKLRRLL